MSADAWTPGTVVEGHRLVRVLGRGGMGEVWLVEHAATGAPRALKVLRGSFAADDVARFQREVEALARVDGHPNVVRVHAAGVHARCPWIVMERVGGGDLATRLEAGPMAPAEAVALVRDLARGLAHVHARGVLHRDLKPQNVLLDERGAPVLVDFGLARLRGAESLTQTGTVLGTPVYMAPEQAQGGRVDERADVYGLGAIFYHTLCGQPPYSGGSPLAVLAKVCEGRMTPPRAVRPEVPRELEAICLRGLALDPGARWPGAAALGRELDAWLARGGRAPRSRAVIAFAGGGAVLVVAGALAALTARSSTPVSPRPTPPPPVAAIASEAPPVVAPTGPWARRFARGEHLGELVRPADRAHGEFLGVLDGLKRDLESNLRRDDLERVRDFAAQGDSTAQFELGKGLLATDRPDALELLWRASRPPHDVLRAGVRLAHELTHGPAEQQDAQGAALLLAEAEERLRADPDQFDALVSRVEIACGLVHLLQPDRAVALREEERSKAAVRERLEGYVQRGRKQRLWPCARFLYGVASLLGWDGPLDPASATERFSELVASADEGARAAATTWLEQLPARRRTWAQRFELESKLDVRRVEYTEWRLRNGSDLARSLRHELADANLRRGALETLELGATSGDASSQRLLGEVLLQAGRAAERARGLHLLWLASREPDPEEHAGTYLASRLIHGPGDDRDPACALLLLVEAGERARRNAETYNEGIVAELVVDLVHLGRDDLAVALLASLPRRDEVAGFLESRAADDPTDAPCSALLHGVAMLEGWRGAIDVPAARARFEALLGSPDASAAAAAKRWLERAR